MFLCQAWQTDQHEMLHITAQESCNQPRKDLFMAYWCPSISITTCCSTGGAGQHANGKHAESDAQAKEKDSAHDVPSKRQKVSNEAGLPPVPQPAPEPSISSELAAIDFMSDDEEVDQLGTPHDNRFDSSDNEEGPAVAAKQPAAPKATSAPLADKPAPAHDSRFDSSDDEESRALASSRDDCPKGASPPPVTERPRTVADHDISNPDNKKPRKQVNDSIREPVGITGKHADQNASNRNDKTSSGDSEAGRERGPGQSKELAQEAVPAADVEGRDEMLADVDESSKDALESSDAADAEVAVHLQGRGEMLLEADEASEDVSEYPDAGDDSDVESDAADALTDADGGTIQGSDLAAEPTVSSSNGSAEEGLSQPDHETQGVAAMEGHADSEQPSGSSSDSSEDEGLSELDEEAHGVSAREAEPDAEAASPAMTSTTLHQSNSRMQDKHPAALHQVISGIQNEQEVPAVAQSAGDASQQQMHQAEQPELKREQRALEGMNSTHRGCA